MLIPRQLFRTLGNDKMTEKFVNTTCPLCGSQIKEFNVSNSNLRFLQQRFDENNLDQAISLASLSWSSFSMAKLGSNEKAIIDVLLAEIKTQLSKSLIPLEMIAKTAYPLSERLDKMIEKVPSELKVEFGELRTQLHDSLKNLQETARNLNEPIQRDLKELFQFINLLTNKPIVKGVINEETLSLSWPEAFPKDNVSKKGGPGQPDLIIIPYLEVNGFQIGQKITIERKSGQQRYSGSHLHEALKHSKIEGSKFCLLIYDSPANLLENQKPIYLTVLDGITVGICDMQTVGWRTLRQLFEVIQAVLPNTEPNPCTLNVTELLKTVEQMHTINVQIELLRKNNNSTLSSCQKVQDNINQLEKIILHYQELLKELLSPKNNTTTFQRQESLILNQDSSKPILKSF